MVFLNLSGSDLHLKKNLKIIYVLWPLCLSFSKTDKRDTIQ